VIDHTLTVNYNNLCAER